MWDLEEAITLATQHVETGRRVVARQRKIVSDGHGGDNGDELLKVFEEALETFEADLDRLLKARDAK